MQTQWRVGFSGPIGLDYGVLPQVFRMVGIPRADWSDVFECLQSMEAEAMRQMEKNSG